MATITIPCIDSIGYLQGEYECNEDGVYIQSVAAVAIGATLGVGGVSHHVGYHEGSVEASTYYAGAVAAFLFDNSNASDLSTAKVTSAKLVFTCGNSFDGAVSFQTLTLRPNIRKGYCQYRPYEGDPWAWDAYLTQREVRNQGNLFYTLSQGEAQQQIEIDLSNSIGTIDAIIQNGVKISTSYKASQTLWYGIMAGESYQPYLELEYLSDETPPIVTPFSPVSDVVNGDQPITFTWNYSQDVNEPQSHYSIQYQSSGDWTTLIPQTAGTAQTATVAANSLPAGQVAWRVMAWSQNGTVQSEWSEPAYIIVQSQPKAPNITNAGTSPSPTFTWQASQQQGYEIKLGDYYDAIQFGVEKSWTYPGTLPDGNVIFQIRIQNAQGIWSPWAGVETYISNVPQGTLSLSANVLNQSVSLTWIGTGFTSSQYNVRRDGELIATVSGTSFTDYYSAGKHTYQVYAMLSGGYYTPSNAITEIVRPKYAMISLVSSISWIPLRIRSGGRPTYSSENQAQASFVHYQGRVLPVAYTTGFLDKSYSYSFSFLRKEDMQTLAKLCGQMVILKTPAGERVVGILTGISDSRQQRINDFSFSITETDFSEVDLNAANNVEVSSFP